MRTNLAGDRRGQRRGRTVRALLAVVVLVAIVAAGCSSDDNKKDTTSSGSTTTAKSGGTAKPSRGFDGTTIKVAGLGFGSNFSDAGPAAQARFKRANDDDELNGIKIEYVGFGDDNNDPAKSITEARRLVTSDKVFAIVPSVSSVTPGQYLKSQKVPYVGWGIDRTYCSPRPSTDIWGFGYNGCSVPSAPPEVPDNYRAVFDYVKEKSGKAQPSLVLFSNDNDSGNNSTRLQKVSAEGTGFKVVYSKGSVPQTVSDYSPYVQQWLNADAGGPPDAIGCLLAVQCIPIWEALKAANYKGVYQTPLYTDLLVKQLQGTVASAFYNPTPSTALKQIQDDLEAFKPGLKLALGSAAGYFGADMFIQALKKVGKNITPDSVQQALAHQTWEIKGVVGPTKYPDSTVISSPNCSALMEDTGGTAWAVAKPYTCSSKTFPVK